jgi:hypothetical protein
VIQVFSKRKDKPHHYGFTDLSSNPDENGVGFDPIEIAISPDTKTWVSIYDVPDLQGVLIADSPYVVPAKQTDTSHKVGINDGEYILSSSYAQREMKVLAVFDGQSQQDVSLAFDALQRFFVSRDPYWVCFDNWPQRIYYVKATNIEQTHLTNGGFAVEITFTDQIGLSRSVGTTADWPNSNIGFGNNEPLVPPVYSFSSNEFDVWNASDVLVDPDRRGHPFKMILKGSSGGKMKITNETTNTSISRDKDWSGTWVLNGVNPELDDKGDLLNTDMGVITLANNSYNHFKISNFSGQISFDFPMWWLS